MAAKGSKPVPPVVNKKRPDGKHVPSAVTGAQVSDNSKAIRQHIDASQNNVPQTPQTVGGNPNPPTTRQASEPDASSAPLTAGFSRYANWY